MPYLVPVAGGIEALGKRNRAILMQQAALATVPIPNVYIFNVGPRVWKGTGGGKEWIVPACPKGEDYAGPLCVPMINLSEIDLADGGNNMGVVVDAGITGEQPIGGKPTHVFGVADDIVGKNSTSPQLDIYTTNGEWFGVFVSRNEEPTEDEIEGAQEKLREMAQLIYSQGSEKVGAGEKVQMSDRKLYNWSAEFLGARPLWGNLDHTMDTCPLCGEDVRQGAKFCKHCHNAIDEASVEAFMLKQERELREELAKQAPAKPAAEEEPADQEPKQAASAKSAKKKARAN